MKKDKEWAKGQLEYYIKAVGDPFNSRTQGMIDAYKNVEHIINQLDEPEVNLDKAFEKVAESYLMTKEEIWRHLERLETHGGKVTYDEPEVLSQEWIDENKVARIDNLRKMTTSDVVTVEKLKNLIVPKQDNPVIPKFVADWIEKWKREELILRDWSRFNLDDENEYEVAEWLYDNDDDEINILRKFTLIDAIRYGYEVEEEKKYLVKLPHESDMGLSLYLSRQFGVEWVDEEIMADHITEAEIKAIDERYWAFAEEVTE